MTPGEKIYLQSMLQVMRAKIQTGTLRNINDVQQYVSQSIAGMDSKITDEDDAALQHDFDPLKETQAAVLKIKASGPERIESIARLAEFVAQYIREGDTASARAVAEKVSSLMKASSYDKFKEKVLREAAVVSEVAPYKLWSDFYKNDPAEIDQAVETLYRRAMNLRAKSI